MSVTLTKIPNPLQPEIRIIETLDYIEGQRLNYYLNDLPLHDTEISFVIAVNGKIISRPHTEIIIYDDDIISVCAKTEITLSAQIAALVASAYIKGSLVYAIVYAAVFVSAMFVIAYGMNALMSALAPDSDTAGSSDYSGSGQTYGWGDLRQTITEGTSIQYLFGTNKISGHVINQFLTISGNKETINILFGLCDHQVDSITDIRINDQPYTYYKDIVVYADRVGTLNDAPIDGFSELVGQNDVGSKLSYNSPVTQQTDGNAVEKLIIFLTAPNGFYYTNDQGGLDGRTATFDVEYRIIGAPSYTLHSHEIFSGATTETQRKSVIIDDTTPGQYEIKITRTNGAETSFRGNSDIYFTSVQEIIKKELIYPGLAKYAIKALATDQLSGSMPALSCLVERSTVRVFDYDLATPAWADKRATNPAWICYSLLITYAGLDKDCVIWDDFSAWADYCDEDVDGAFRFIVNTSVYTGNFWGQLQQIAKLGHAVVIRRGVKYGAFVDKQDSIISHLFTMGNIVKGSFDLQFLAKKDRANAVEIEYTDPARDYTRQVVTIHTNGFLTTSEVVLPARVSIKASISQAQAIREGVFSINSNIYMNRVVTFDAFVDSFACTIGDLFYFQHENVNYQGSNTGGMIKTAGNDDGFGNPFVQLDTPIEIETSISYRVMVRLVNSSNEEEFVEKIVNNTSGSTDVLTLTTPWDTVPDDFAIFLFGTATTYKKPYRIISIDRKDDFVRTISGLQYVDEIYTDNSSTIIVEPPWEIHKQVAVQVLLHEFLIYQKNGQFASNIQVTWHNGYMNTGSNWAIWLEDLTAGTSPTKIATVHENMYTITAPLVVGSGYKIYVAVDGEGAVDTGGNTQTITMQGQLAPPASVLNFSGSWDAMKRQVHFTWTANSELDLNHYEIREGSVWATGIVVARPTTNFNSIFIDEGVSETKTYKIKAVDTSGIYSDTESSIGVSINTSDCPLTIPGDLAVSSNVTQVFGGGTVVTMLATWNGAAEVSAEWHHYDILLENTAAGSFSSFSTANRQFQWEVMPNKEYGVSVRAVDRSGNHTNWATQVLHTTAIDEIAPAIPTWPATGFAISGFKMVGLSWNDNTEYDFSHYILERSTVSNFASDITVLGNISASFYPDSAGLDVTTTYYYRLKSVDTSGNASEYSVIKSATTGQIGGNDLAADSIIASHIQTFDLTAISAKITGILKAGKIQSNNYSTTAGVEIDLDNELVKFGGSANPKLSWNGVSLGIKGSITIEGGSGYSALTDIPTSLSDINPGEFNIIQNSIETWFDDGEPTLVNTPASGWATTVLRDQHLGDLYYDNATGYAYRFRIVATTYSWLRLTDSDITQALAAAFTAQDTADGKRRVFLPGQNPTVPYDQGDLWDTGSGINRCQTAKLSNQTYAAGDWVGVADVTDYTAITTEIQTKANLAQAAAETYALAKANLAETTATAHADNIVTAEEARAIADALARANTAQATAEATAQAFTEAWSEENATDDADLRHTSDTSMIDGGKIYAGSNIQVGNLDGVSDYVSMTPELLQYFKYFNEIIGHQPSKALTRMDIGICNNNETIPLNGYWAKAPRVFVTPDNMMVYDSTASAFSQSLICPEPIPALVSTGKYQITPQITLEQTNGTGGGSINVSKGITKDYDGPVVIETGPEFLIPEAETESMSVIVSLTGGHQIKTQNESAKDPGPYTYSYSAYLALGRIHLQYYAGGVWNDTTWETQWFYPMQATTFQYDISHASFITKLRMQVSASDWWVMNNIGSYMGAYNFGPVGLSYGVTMSSYLSALTDNTPLAVGTVRYFAIAEE